MDSINKAKALVYFERVSIGNIWVAGLPSDIYFQIGTLTNINV